MTARRVIRDHLGEPVTISDVGPIDDAPEHTHTVYVAGCWACRGTYRCTVDNCTDVAVEGHVCVAHGRRWVA